MRNFEPDVINNGTNAVRTYKLDGVHRATSGLMEYQKYRVPNLFANTPRVVPITTTFVPRTVWVDVANPNQADLDFEVLFEGSMLYKWSLAWANFPKELPVIVLDPRYSFRITPIFNIDNVFIEGEIVAQLDEVIIP